jgi:hypothetical protein
MNCKYLYLRNAVFLLLIAALFSTVLIAQKKPRSVKLDVDGDDRKICREELSGSQFCEFFDTYERNKNGNNIGKLEARDARNEMIQLVRGQIDTFYKLRKDSRSSKIRVFQTILDFLRIGGDLAVTIMNGERAKTVVSAVLGGIDNGRTSFNKNFQILQTQVLINKMNANRAEIMTEIVGNLNKPISEYSWYAAKNDLRRYLFAGTFDNALDTLVNESGADVANAEQELRNVERRTIVDEATPQGILQTDDFFDTLNALEANLADNNTRDDALTKLRNIVTQLEGVPRFKTFLNTKNVTAQSDGTEIVKGIRLLSRDLAADNAADNSALTDQLERTVIKFGK